MPESFGIPPSDDYVRILCALRLFSSTDLTALPQEMVERLTRLRDHLENVVGPQGRDPQMDYLLKSHTQNEVFLLIEDLKRFAIQCRVERVASHLTQVPVKPRHPSLDDYVRILDSLGKFSPDDIELLPQDLATLLKNFRDDLERACDLFRLDLEIKRVKHEIPFSVAVSVSKGEIRSSSSSFCRKSRHG